MPREPKSLGVKILWFWTFGTAASTLSSYPFSLIFLILFTPINYINLTLLFVTVLVTNVMRTRIREFETQMNAQQQQLDDASTSDSSLVDTLSHPSDSVTSINKDWFAILFLSSVPVLEFVSLFKLGKDKGAR